MYFLWIRDVVTLDRAHTIKNLQQEEDCSWRGVSYECYEKWHHEFPSWGLELRGNQLIGMDLCEAAGEKLGDSKWRDW